MKLLPVNSFSKIRCLGLLACVFSMGIPGISVLSASAENPWHQDSKPLIDEPKQEPIESWSADSSNLPAGKVDDSKFPPFDEDTTLGTNLPPAAPREGTTTQYAKPPTSTESSSYSGPHTFGQRPVYPDNYSQNLYGGYGVDPYQTYRPRTQYGYQPEYQGGYYSPRYNNWGSGLPFGGYPGTGFPFGRNNNWMPFSGSGFW